MNHLPAEVLCLIYQFDSTYRDYFQQKVIPELFKTTYQLQVNKYGDMLWNGNLTTQKFYKLTTDTLCTHKKRLADFHKNEIKRIQKAMVVDKQKIVEVTMRIKVKKQIIQVYKRHAKLYEKEIGAQCEKMAEDKKKIVDINMQIKVKADRLKELKKRCLI